MPNVIYNVSNIGDWVDVAKLMKKRHDWKPKYWLSHSDIEEEFREEFPDAVFHLRSKACRSLPPEDYSNSFQYALDEDEMIENAVEMSNSIKIMDRMDPNFGGSVFEYDERVRNHFRLVMWWRNVIEDRHIDKAVFVRPPHTTSQYPLYLACKQTDTDTIMMKDAIALPEVVYSQKEVGESAIKTDTTSKEELPSRIEKHIEEIREAPSESKSKPEIKKKRRQNYIAQLKPLSRCLLFNPKKLGKKFSDKRIKKREQDIEDSEYSYLEDKHRSIMENLKKIRLHRNYNSKSKKPDYSTKYVYLPLHYQPELTSNPQGGIFVHQFLVANMISSSLPDNWKLIIKEHPYTFFKRKPYGRKKYHYRHLEKLDSVELVNIESDQMKLIDNAEAVATITGTSGWEALLRETPAILFGNAWYKQCNGAHRVGSKEEITELINNIENYELRQEDIEDFLSQLIESSSQAYLDKEQKKNSNLGQKNNVEALKSKLEEYA
jgi:hypothetical protein